MPKDEVISLVANAAAALADGRVLDAQRAVGSVDFPGLIQGRKEAYERVWGRPGGSATGYKSPRLGTRGGQPLIADVRATFNRDHYTCRYCERQTISPNVLRLLSSAFPDVLPYHSNWRPLEAHILYWTYSTSLEHILPFPLGGTNHATNLITSCYQCNDLKNYLPIDRLGWRVADPVQSGWAGLTEHIPALRAQASCRVTTSTVRPFNAIV